MYVNLLTRWQLITFGTWAKGLTIRLLPRWMKGDGTPLPELIWICPPRQEHKTNRFMSTMKCSGRSVRPDSLDTRSFTCQRCQLSSRQVKVYITMSDHSSVRRSVICNAPDGVLLFHFQWDQSIVPNWATQFVWSEFADTSLHCDSTPRCE